jgi:hypothetical protein
VGHAENVLTLSCFGSSSRGRYQGCLLKCVELLGGEFSFDSAYHESKL